LIATSHDEHLNEINNTVYTQVMLYDPSTQKGYAAHQHLS